MKKSSMYSLVLFALLFAASQGAHSDPFSPDGRRPQPTPAPKKAPEFDPALATGGVLLLAGAVTLLRMRRSK